MTSDSHVEPELPAWLEALVGVSAAIAASDWDAVEDGFKHLVSTDCAPEVVEEMILQLYLFVGFPAALTAARIWRGLNTRDAIETDPLAAPERLDEWEARGVETCRIVYGSAYATLRTNVAAIHPALDRWMVLEGYGKVLSRPGLELPHRELCIVGMLAAGGWDEQLHSHLRGALLAGASVEWVDRVLEIGLGRVGPSDAARLRTLWNRVREGIGGVGDVH